MGGQQQLVSGLFIQLFGFSWFSCITLSTKMYTNKKKKKAK
jgi:hypothetical protein